jgi:uncharacterized protein (TIGR03067 family)
MRLMVLGTFVLALAASPTPAADEAKEKKFKYLKIVIDGKETPKKEIADMVLKVSEEGVGTVTKGDKVLYKGKAKMDMSKTPWEIDVKLSAGKDKGKISKGIMEMKDKTMKVCWGAPGKDRPTEFKSEKGSGNIYEEMEEVEEK